MQISSESLVQKLKVLVLQERKLMLEILTLLREVERRRVFSEQGYSSLHDWCVKVLGYSSGAAFRRIESMRLLEEIPSAKKQIEEGTLTLTTLSQARTFFKREKNLDIEAKRELLNELQGKSTREVEKHLVSLSPLHVPQERVRELTAEKTEIRFVADRELMELLEQVKDSMGGKNAYPDYATLFKVLARAHLAKYRKAPKAGTLAPRQHNVWAASVQKTASIAVPTPRLNSASPAATPNSSSASPAATPKSSSVNLAPAPSSLKVGAPAPEVVSKIKIRPLEVVFCLQFYQG